MWVHIYAGVYVRWPILVVAIRCCSIDGHTGGYLFGAHDSWCMDFGAISGVRICGCYRRALCLLHKSRFGWHQMQRGISLRLITSKKKKKKKKKKKLKLILTTTN